MANTTSLDPKAQEAIDAALENNWKEALQLNQELIRKYPDDVDTMNRLARSLSETGKIGEAKKLYKRVLALDPYNRIAEKNLAKLSSVKKADLAENQVTPSLKGDLFLEEAGKTCTVILEDTAMPSVLAGLRTGNKTTLSPHRNNLTVISSKGNRIGKIGGSLAQRIIKDLRAGSKFESIIKSVSLGNNLAKKHESVVAIFIRENRRSSKVSSSPFPSQPSSFTPYIREEAMNLLSNQTPVPTEADDSIEEVEISQLPSASQEQSLEDLAEKEQEESDNLEEEQ
jgi:hypothetical protein